MLNVEQIASSLARMPDQALQRYAAMHKNDPYIIALAMSESNRRKEMRNAAQGAQGQMPQPKVVDQDIAAMAPQAAPMPEDQGIARLPAGPMNFAGGSIVAFAGGGDVERYNKDGLIPPSAGTEYGIPGMMLPATSFMPQAGVGQEETPWLRRQWEEFSAGQRQKRIAEVEAKIAAGDKSPDTKAYLDSLKAAETSPAAPQTEVAQSAGAANRGLLNRTEQRMFPSAYATPGAGAAGNVAPKADTTQRNLGTGQAAVPTGGFASLMNAIKAPDTAADQVNPFTKQMQDLTAERVKAREKEAEGLEAIQKQYADVFKGREERLSKREGELAGMKDQSLGLALLQAGAAMMSTPGSLGMALGKGVDVGSRQYVAGMDKLNAAKEKLSDARDRLEELQAQRGELSAREMLKAKSAIDTEKAAGQELLIKANMDLYKISREEAIKRLELQTRVGIAQLQEQGAAARAAMPSGMERLYSTLGGGDVKKGFDYYTSATGAEAKGQSAILQKFATLEGQATLKMMEASNDPQQQMLAQSIRAQLQNAMLTPMKEPTGPVRP